MPLDGLFLHCLCDELKSAQGSRVEKIYQPSHDEFVFHLRGKDFNKKLLITVSGAAARIHFTSLNFENPAMPPTLCMLVRKHFQSARLERVEQLSLDRVITLTFSSFNELGDEVTLQVIVEIMGRKANVIFACNGRIIDALRRTDPEKADRLILPGAVYRYPEIRNRFDILNCDLEQAATLTNAAEAPLAGAIAEHFEGVSPLVAREIALRVTGNTDAKCPLTGAQFIQFKRQLERLRALVEKADPYLIGDRDYSFMPIDQYGAENTVESSFSQLLDEFYKSRTMEDTIKRKAHDLFKLISSLTERTARKIEKQRGELARCADKEKLRIYGELIKANMYHIEKGAPYCEVEDYYQDPPVTVRIPLKPELSAAANAQRYFKDYKKAHTAEDMLTKLIADGQKELEYFDSVFDCITRASGEKDLAQIRAELAEQGYIRLPKSARRQPQALPAMQFEKDGFEIFVGRNNRQNDMLTLKESAKSDIWLHTKNVHGSHTVIAAKGRQVPEEVILYAACLAAYHSKARQSSQVAVDYCLVKHVKKPAGSKPGMVLYDNYKTVYVTPKEK